MISVIIPARQEPYINKTIESLYDNATGEIEVIVILEGERVEIDPRAKVIFHPNPMGRRVGMNEAVKEANGKYLLHIDAHCSMSPGWDEKLIESCKEKTLVVSVVAAMDETTWQIKPNHYYTFVSMDSNLKEHWWGKYKPLRKCAVEEETMAFTGCGWLIRKDFYESLGGCDESLGQLCHLGPEWALKVWCNGGRMVLRTDVFCGHVFGSPKIQNYSPQHIGDYDFANRMRKQYGTKIDALREKFDPPGWEEDVIVAEEVKEEVKICRRTTINDKEAFKKENTDKPWVTCFMMYYGRYDVAQEAVESFLAQTYPNKKLMIVNTHPDPVYFKEDLSDYNIEVHTLPDMELGKKYEWAIKHIDTQWCIAWDSDDIYLPWHIENIVANITPQNGKPRKIGELYRFASNHNAIRGFGGRMWQMFILETEALKSMESPQENFTMIDWDEYLIDQKKYPLSFIYRWGMNIPHGSSRATKDERDEHSRLAREKYNAIPLKEPFRPHWKRNYIEDCRIYLANNPGLPIATGEELLKLIPNL